MSNTDKYKGIFPAFYACYEDNGDISIERTKKLARYFLDKGVNGVYVSGSSGECIYHSLEERKAVIKAVCEELKGKITIISHVACNNTKDSMELAAFAQECGSDAIAAIPPIYFKLPDYAIAKYWNDISLAAPDTDFIIYNIPQLAGVSLTQSLLKEMYKNPRVVGVKNSSMPVQDIQIFKSVGGHDKVVFNGPDEQLISGLAIGADGGIGGTYGAVPEAYLAIYDLVKNGELEKALTIQNKANELIYKMCSCTGNMYGVIKEILRREENIDIGGVRSPLYSLVESDYAIIEECCRLVRELRELI